VDKDDLKKEAITAYVLHLIIWGELSDPEFYKGKELFNTLRLKEATVAVKKMGAKDCEFCHFAQIMMERENLEEEGLSEHGQCAYCPAKFEEDYGYFCLGNKYFNWRYTNTPEQKAKAAAEIRDIELRDWFKDLLK